MQNLVDMQNLVNFLKGYLEIVFFRLIFSPKLSHEDNFEEGKN